MYLELGHRAERCDKWDGCITTSCGKCINCIHIPHFGGSEVIERSSTYHKCKAFHPLSSW